MIKISTLSRFAGQLSTSQRAFTLIELLVSVVVLVTVGVVLAATLFSSLRGATKTTNVVQAKQNGYYALAQMTKMLRNAQKIDDPYPCTIPPDPTPTPTYTSIKFTSPDGGQTTFACNGSTIASNSASLLDTSTVSLEEGSCYFTCSRNTVLEPPVIGISFVLKQASSSKLAERTVSMPFETSIILRNVRR